jgi:hypothetical protein
MVSWNNKQAPLWSAADDHYAFSSIYRSQMIEAGIKRALAGGGKMRIEQLISAMDEAATTDIRAFALWPILKKVLGTPSDPRLADAISKLDAWAADGGHRRDLNNRDITKPGVYQHNDAITIMDAWYPLLVEGMFRAPLGDAVLSQLRQISDYGSIAAGTPASGYPDFADGWYGYISKDLRDVLAHAAAPAAAKPRCRFVRRRIRTGAHRGQLRRVRVCAKPKHAKAKPKPKPKRHAKARPVVAAPPGAYSRLYCGGGSLSACRQILQSTLLAALSVTPQQIYGNGGACASNPQASCYDMNTSVIAGGISIPPFPFQNRPTFQQVVELTSTLPR